MRAVLVLCLLAALGWVQTEAGTMLPSWAVKIAMEQGPNTCVVEEVPGTNKKFWTECRFYSHRRVCGQKTVLRYECCEGFERIKGQKGCMKVKPLKDLLSTLEEIGAKKFADYLSRSDLKDELLADREAFTLFAPTDEAFLEHGFGQGNLGPTIYQYHVSRNRFSDLDLASDAVLDTTLPGRSIRVNKHSTGLLTVDCVPIVRKNVLATNGVIHLIDGVLDPKKSKQMQAATALTMDSRFTQFARWMQETGIAEELNCRRDVYTIFAPTDEAFGKYPRSKWEKIFNDTTARKAFVENHIVPGAVCPAAVIEGKGELKTFAGSAGGIVVECDEVGVKVGGSRASGDFTVAENGVIVTVDDVLLPTRAMSVTELAERHGNLTTWLELSTVAGLKDTMETYGDYTYFAPTDEAFQALGQDAVSELRSNPSKARRLVLFHGMQGIFQEKQMVGDKAVTSLDEENRLRLQSHRGGYSVETGMMGRRAEMRGRNGVIHPINKVLQSAKLSAGDYLRKDGRFKTFLKLMDMAMARNPLLLESSVSGSKDFFTFFVPTDEAFAKLRAPKVITALDTQPQYVEEFIRNHILPKLVCSRVFEEGLTYRLQSMLQVHLASINSEGHITIGKANVTEKDVSTTNGIVHIINRVLVPKRVGNLANVGVSGGGSRISLDSESEGEESTGMARSQSHGRAANKANSISASYHEENRDESNHVRGTGNNARTNDQTAGYGEFDDNTVTSTGGRISSGHHANAGGSSSSGGSRSRTSTSHSIITSGGPVSKTTATRNSTYSATTYRSGVPVNSSSSSYSMKTYLVPLGEGADSASGSQQTGFSRISSTSSAARAGSSIIDAEQGRAGGTYSVKSHSVPIPGGSSSYTVKSYSSGPASGGSSSSGQRSSSSYSYRSSWSSSSGSGSSGDTATHLTSGDNLAKELLDKTRTNLRGRGDIPLDN